MANTSEEPITLLAGTRVAKLTPVTNVPTEDVLGHECRPWCVSVQEVIFTLWVAAQVTATVSSSWQINYVLWGCIMMNMATCFCLAALITAGMGKAADSWVHSIHEPTEEDATATRQTTVRHRARTRLNMDDIRRAETGQEFIKRLRKEMQKQKKLAAEYEAWQKQIGCKFKFGSILTAEERDGICVLLFVYKEMFIENTKAPPAIDGIEYALYFRYNDPIPVRRRVPRLSPMQMAHMEKETVEMLRNHTIEFSDSDWATAPVFAKKKDGTLRCAIDYRKLNQSLLHDGMPLPNIPETLESLSKPSRYSCWDACAGFWGIRVRPKDRKCLAFHARFQGAWQLFTWLRMPFGVKSATACFQTMMSNVMGRGTCICGKDSFVEDNEHSDECHDGTVSLINSICKVFVDDGVTHSTSHHQRPMCCAN